MVMRLWIYVGIASIPAMAYAVLILSMAIAEMVSKGTNPKILLCNPPLSMHPRVTNFWINWNGFSNRGLLIIYVAVYVVVSTRDKRHRDMGRFVKQTTERKVLNSLLWLITIFVSTWCAANISLVITAWFEPEFISSPVEAGCYQATVVFALMAYSVNYYVYFAINHAYYI
ncbi:hypothetical protein Aduo_013205 [Ancylostoma duodenale]